MSERKWTPGPWKFDGETEVCMEDDVCAWICNVNFDGTSEVQADADAHLISAAPGLFELADLVNRSFSGGRTMTFTEDDVARFADVIAKARGEQ